MQHRDGMRQRQIDDNKPYQVIKNIETTKKTLSHEDMKELEKIENDLYKVIKHFDSKKKNTIKELEENNKNILKNFDIIKNVLNKYETEEKIKKEKNDEIENIQIIKEEYIKEIEKYNKNNRYPNFWDCIGNNNCKSFRKKKK